MLPKSVPSSSVASSPEPHGHRVELGGSAEDVQKALALGVLLGFRLRSLGPLLKGIDGDVYGLGFRA